MWYEEPVLADDSAACAEVARAITIPVATGENNYTRYEFRDLLERKAARYLMPDVCRANGYSETLKIGHLAAAHGSPSRRTWCTSCRCRSAARSANGFLVEYMDWAPPDLFEALPACRDGEFRIPSKPGPRHRDYQGSAQEIPNLKIRDGPRFLSMRSYSEMTCAPRSRNVARISRLSRTTIAVVSEP